MTVSTITLNQLESHLWEAANDYNLNIPRYVEPTVDQDVLTVEQAMQCLKASAEGAFAAEDKLIVLLKREGLLQ